MENNKPDIDLQSGFSLGPWAILPNQNRIERDTDSTHLEPKVMQVLCVLARNQGEVVSRQALIAEVWQGTFVTDEVLSRAVSVLRKQLGDDSRNPEYIATVPKAGYRLVRDVVTTRPKTTEPSAIELPVPRRSVWRARVSIAVLLLLLITVGYLWEEQAPTPPVDPRSPTLFADLSDWFELIIRGDIPAESVTNIAVLPFDDISEQAGNTFLSDGLTDELISSLGQLEGLKVVARSSSLNFRHRYEDVRTIGDILDVQAVVEGTVRRSADRIRISAQLSSTRDGYVLWSQTFERDLQDLLLLQAEISQEIVLALREKLGLDTLVSPTVNASPPDMQAYQLYLNGRFLWKLRGEAPLRESIALYEQALQLDAGFTRARLALANSIVLLPSYSSESEDSAFNSAQAILDDISVVTAAEAGEVEAIKGFIAFRRWQWQASEDAFHKALMLAPNNPNLYVWYSQLLSAVGRNVDALKTAQQAHDLDSVSPVINHRLATAYLWNNNNVRAAEQFARGAELGFINQRSAAYLIFLLRMERFDEARRVITNLYAGSGLDPQWLVDNIQAIKQGDRDLVDAADSAVNTGDIAPEIVLGLWLYLNQPERAYGALESLANDKKYIHFEFLFSEEARAFRGSSEFSDMVDELGLQSYWDNWRGPDEG
jgi:TolB-like protein/DNA-binding winged helix-turn-helix (wHTH) protein